MTEADGSDSLVAPACYSGLTLKLVRGDGLENACPEGCRSEKPDLIEISPQRNRNDDDPGEPDQRLRIEPIPQRNHSPRKLRPEDSAARKRSREKNTGWS